MTKGESLTAPYWHEEGLYVWVMHVHVMCKPIVIERPIELLRLVWQNWESDGTGFMCLLAAALPGLYLDPAAGDSSLIPPRELHIDLSSPLDLKTGVLELGIVGSFEDALSGVVHMGHCFRSLQWLVQANLGLSHHLRERKATPRLFARCFVVGGVRPKEEGVLPWLAQAFGYRLDVQHLGGKDAGQQD